ncbi:MAG: hypothetical protein WEA10_08045 [Actinomycetota bacterium]
MSGYRHEQGQNVVVASAPTPSEAEFIKITLAVHGIDAVVSAASSIYPAIDFVQGSTVSVQASDAERARALLSQLGLTGDDPDVDDPSQPPYTP